MPNYRRERDGVRVLEDEACDAKGCLRDGYVLGFSIDMMDAARAAVNPTTGILTDSAGKPLSLVDADTGAPVTMNADVVAAMVAEAGRLSMPLKRYVAEVLRYAEAEQLLSGGMSA